MQGRRKREERGVSLRPKSLWLILAVSLYLQNFMTWLELNHPGNSYFIELFAAHENGLTAADAPMLLVSTWHVDTISAMSSATGKSMKFGLELKWPVIRPK
jgi:hypothetical protein